MPRGNRARILYSQAEIERVMNEVCDEMNEHGLLTKGVRRAPVVTVATSAHVFLAYGLYIVEASPMISLLGFRRGGIYIPQLSFQGALDRLGRTRVTLRD